MSYNKFISKEMSIKNQFLETEQSNKNVVAIKYSNEKGQLVDEQVDIKAAREKRLDVMRTLIVSEELSHEEKHTSTSMIASNEFAVRVIELDGNREAALEEVHRIEDLVNGNPRFQAVAHKIYQKMESSAEKHGHPGEISGLMTKNGQVGEQDMSYFIAYVALQELRHSNSPLAKEAELVFTESPEEAAIRFDELLRNSLIAEQTRNSALITAESKGSEDRTIPKLYVAPAENEQNLFSISFQAMARSYTGNGRVLRWNTGVSATTILRDEELSVLFASKEEQVPADGQPAPVEAPAESVPPVPPPPVNPTEPPTPETNKKEADTESGKMLRRLGKVAATITAVALVSKGGSMIKEAIENRQGESSKELSKRLIKWSAMAAYAVPATVIAFKTLNSVKGKIDGSRLDQLKKDAWKVALGGMGLYITRGIVRHFSGVDVFNPEDVTRVARDLGAKFTSKVEKGVKAAEEPKVEAEAGEPTERPKVRILETVRINLSKAEQAIFELEKTGDALKAQIVQIDKVMEALGSDLIIPIPFTDIKINVGANKLVQPAKDVFDRMKVMMVGLSEKEQPKEGLRTYGALGRADIILETTRAKISGMRTTIEALQAGSEEGPFAFLREIFQPFWYSPEEEEWLRQQKQNPQPAAAPAEAQSNRPKPQTRDVIAVMQQAGLDQGATSDEVNAALEAAGFDTEGFAW